MHLTRTQRWLALAGICLPMAIQPLNWAIVDTALPTIQRELGASVLQLAWMLNSFGLCISIFLVTMGRLADIYGRRKFFLMGAIGIGVASLIAGFAPHPGWIIATQGLQGLAGSILMPVSQALLTQLFPEEQRHKAIAIWAAVFGIALGLGPILGGCIITAFGWRWIFFINIPLVLVGIFLLLRYVDESKSQHHGGKVDPLGVLLLALSIGCLILGVMQGPNWGWTSILTLSLFALFVLFTTFFILSERNAEYPIVRPDFFFKRTFLLSSLINFCMVFFLWADFFLLPLYLQNALHYTPLQTGLIMLLATVPVTLLSSPVGKLYNKFGLKPLALLGSALLIISAISQLFFTDQNPIYLTALAVFTFGLGWVIIWGPSTTHAIMSVPRDAAGVASGAFTTIQEIGGTVGLAITSTVFAMGTTFLSSYHHGVQVLLALAILGLFITLCLKNHYHKQTS